MCASLSYVTDVGSRVFPSFKVITHLLRLPNTEQEKHGCQPFLALKSISAVGLHLWAETFRTSQGRSEQKVHYEHWERCQHFT